MIQLQQLREKIITAGNLRGVVETMRGLAAVNIRRAEVAAMQGEKYERTVHLALHVAMKSIEKGGSALYPAAGNERGTVSGMAVGRSHDDLLGAVVITTDQGLCGQFNDRIISYAQRLFDEDTNRRVAMIGSDGAMDRPAENRRLVVIGMRGFERLDSDGEHIIAHLDAPGSVEVIPTVVSQAFSSFEDLLGSGKIGRLLVIYNRLRQGSTFGESHLQLAPFDSSRWVDLPEGESPWATLPDFSIPVHELLPLLVKEQVYIDLFRALTQSFAAENAARLASMQSAADNIEERLNELEGQYRRARQDVITSELMDLMGGVEAVRS